MNEFEFNFKGLEVKVTDFHYTPSYPATRTSPPEDSEVEINEAFVKGIGKWHRLSEPVLEWLLEDDDFYNEALFQCETSLNEWNETRLEDEGDYRYQLWKDEER